MQHLPCRLPLVPVEGNSGLHFPPSQRRAAAASTDGSRQRPGHAGSGSATISHTTGPASFQHPCKLTVAFRPGAIVHNPCQTDRKSPKERPDNAIVKFKK